MEIGFPEALAVLGLTLALAAMASGLVRRTVLSIAVLATAAGAALALTDVIVVDAASKAVIIVVELVLLVTLFADGLLVEQSFLRHHWRGPARALIVAMPLNATLLALLAKGLFGELGWTEAFLVGFVLSPTDPVITSSVVTSANVPDRVRNLLNLESGLNDGLALPFVVLFLALASGGQDAPVADLALETVIGLGFGVALGLGAGLLLVRLPEWAIHHDEVGQYALGVGLLAYGGADLLGGNGLIAAFAGGAALAFPRNEIASVFGEFSEGLAHVLQVVAFAVFGALVVTNDFGSETLLVFAFGLLAIVVVRPLSILVAFRGIDLRRDEQLFVAWFGPKGIASILFALFVVNSSAPNASLAFDVAAATILLSILAHGLTDTVAANWIERRLAG